MRQRASRQRFRPGVAPLEGRALLAPFGWPPPPGFSLLRPYLARLNTADGSGFPAILDALRGGPGREFVGLIRRYEPNPLGVALQFASGQIDEYAIPGLAFRTPKLRDAYTGPRLDQFNPIASGVVRQPSGVVTLGAILRGPIDLPLDNTYVWGFDRGLGRAVAPFADQPGVAIDSMIVAHRAPDGSTSALFLDLPSGHAASLNVPIAVQGPTVRLRLDPALADLLGVATPSARFTFWTMGGPGAGSAAIGQFVPTGMVPVGRLGR